jgi:hypothetical protein
MASVVSLEARNDTHYPATDAMWADVPYGRDGSGGGGWVATVNASWAAAVLPCGIASTYV